jgi:hypothetical protein
MGADLLQVPLRDGYKITVICLILALLCAISQSASAETTTLVISGNDLAPGTIYLGEPYNRNMTNIPMLQIKFTTTHEEGITINSLTLQRTGQSADSDVAKIHLYKDVNNNQSLDQGTDTLLSSGDFELGRVELAVARTITSDVSYSILVVLNISSEIDSDGTVGISVPDESFVDCEAGVVKEFEFPINSKNSSLLFDTDGDLNPDSTDSDDDNDGYGDAIETQAGSDPKDPTSRPEDFDSDFVPDSIDTDDDNDGTPDRYDDFPKDKSRQRDYTVVMIYIWIAVILLVIMTVIATKAKPKGIESEIDYESDDDFAIDKKELEEDMDDKILSEDEKELLEDS